MCYRGLLVARHVDFKLIVLFFVCQQCIYCIVTLKFSVNKMFSFFQIHLSKNCSDTQYCQV